MFNCLTHRISKLQLLAIIMPFLLLICGYSYAQSNPQIKTQVQLPQPGQQKQESKPLIKPPEITSEEIGGFHDLVFYIAQHKKLPDGTQVLWASGIHKGQHLGFEVVLSPEWKTDTSNKKIPIKIYSGIVTCRSIGQESNTFIQVLDQIYATHLNPKTIKPKTKFSAMSIEGNPNSLEKGLTKIKIFYDSDKEDEYAEAFIDIELSANKLTFAEKDTDYRAPLVKALKAH